MPRKKTGPGSATRKPAKSTHIKPGSRPGTPEKDSVPKNRGGAETQGGKPRGARVAPFPIVGIGASAGGLEAYEQLFTNMPPDTGMAFVLVQHLDPTHKSILGELVQRYTRMKVRRVEDGMRVEPNCVYIIPPDRDMAILPETLHLIEPVAPRGLRAPIDAFFRSLAKDQQERAICTVLSGTSSEGTWGRRRHGDGAGPVSRSLAGGGRPRRLRGDLRPARESRRRPIVTLHAAEPDAFDGPESALLEQLVSHISPALNAARRGRSH
jgi:two-component system CheB/CheR fusion protein